MIIFLLQRLVACTFAKYLVTQLLHRLQMWYFESSCDNWNNRTKSGFFGDTLENSVVQVNGDVSVQNTRFKSVCTLNQTKTHSRIIAIAEKCSPNCHLLMIPFIEQSRLSLFADESRQGFAKNSHDNDRGKPSILLKKVLQSESETTETDAMFSVYGILVSNKLPLAVEMKHKLHFKLFTSSIKS